MLAGRTLCGGYSESHNYYYDSVPGINVIESHYLTHIFSSRGKWNTAIGYVSVGHVKLCIRF